MYTIFFNILCLNKNYFFLTSNYEVEKLFKLQNAVYSLYKNYGLSDTNVNWLLKVGLIFNQFILKKSICENIHFKQKIYNS